MMVFGLGLGKPRTRLGRFLDSEGLTQGYLEGITGISETTITKLCNDKTYRPSEKTKMRIIVALEDEGYDVHMGSFW